MSPARHSSTARSNASALRLGDAGHRENKETVDKQWLKDLKGIKGEFMLKYLIITLLLILAACDNFTMASTPPTPVTPTISLNPAAWNFQYSPNMPATPSPSTTGKWQFTFPAVDGVHYLVTGVNKLSGTTLTFAAEVDVSPM
jgi:hypothetical protein